MYKHSFYQALLFSFLICLSSSSIIDKFKWTLNVLDENRQASPIKVYPGRYTKIYLTISTESKKIFPATAKFKLNSDLFTTEKDEYDVNTYESMEVEAYIGISCTKVPSSVLTYEVDFKKTGGLSLFTINKFTVNIVNDISMNVVDFTTLMSDVPINTYGVLQMNQKLYNVDAMTLSYTNEELPELQFESVSIAPFTNSDSDILTLNNKGYFGKYYSTRSLGDGESVPYNFKPVVDNKCYSVKNDIKFNYLVSEPARINEFTKSQIVNTIESVVPEEDNSIQLQMTVPIAPLVISCKASFLLGSNDEDEIREQRGTQSKEMRYAKTIVTEANSIQKITFYNLTRLGLFTVKCLVDNTIERDYSSETIIIGKVKGADIVKPLQAKLSADTPSQCATFSFETTPLLPSFESDAKNFCEYTMSGTTSFFGSLKNGCMNCYVRSVSGSKTYSICAAVLPYCPTKFTGDAKELFNTFVTGLSTKQGIEDNLELTGYSEPKVSVEIEESSPDKSKIKVEKIEQGLLSVSFSVTNENDKDIECNYNGNLDITTLYKYMTPHILSKTTVTVPKGETMTIKTTLLSFKQDKAYSLYMNCHYLPGFDNHYYSTGVFPAVTFLNTKETVKDYIEKKMNNCTENKRAPECIVKKVKNAYRQFKSDIPKIIEDIEEDVEKFANLVNTEQLVILSKLNTTLQEAIKKGQSELSTIVNKAIELGEYLANRDCLIYNNYDECRLSKKQIQAQIVSVIKQYFKCDSLIADIKALPITDGTLADKLKYLLLLLSDTTFNADSLNQGDSEILSDLSYCLTDSFDAIWTEAKKELEDKGTKTLAQIKVLKSDMANMLIETVSNLIDSINYDEIDQYIDKTVEVIDKSKILVSERAKQVRNKIEEVVKKLWEYGSGHFEISNININIDIDVNVDIKVSSRRLEETNANLISFPDKGVKLEINKSGLKSKYNADIIQVFLYEKYPMLSVDNDKISPNFLSIKLYYQNGTDINVTDLDDSLKPKLYYNKTMHNTKRCYYFDEKEGDLSRDGISDNEEGDYKVCSMSHFTDFTVGEVGNAGLPWWGILLIVLGVLLVLAAGALIVMKVILPKTKSTSIERLNEAQV